jgi:hypothetical protein
MSKKFDIQLIKDPVKYWKSAYLCQLGLKRRLSKKYGDLIQKHNTLLAGMEALLIPDDLSSLLYDIQPGDPIYVASHLIKELIDNDKL